MRDPADRIKDKGFCSIFREKILKLPTNPKNCTDSLLDGNFQFFTLQKKPQIRLNSYAVFRKKHGIVSKYRINAMNNSKTN